METVDSLIKRFKTSRKTIYKHLHKLYVQDDDLIKHTYTKKGRRYFDDVLVNALDKSLNHKDHNKQPYQKNNYLEFTELQHKIHDLEIELKNKNDRINNQDRHIQSQQQAIQHAYTIQGDQNYSIKKLENLLDQQQQLSLADKKDKKDLQDQVKHLKLLNGPKKDDVKDRNDQSTNDTKTKKRGILGRLFDKL